MKTIRLMAKASGLICAMLFAAISANAQTTFTWTGAINNNWNVAGNWTKVGASTSTFPNQNTLQNDQAIINSGAPIVNASFTNGSLTSVIRASPGNLILSGAFTLTITGNLTGTGTLSQSAGTINVSENVSISTLTISAGTFVYNGTGAQTVKETTYNSFIKSGAGTATLAGNVIAAATTISAGTLDFGPANNFSATTLTGAGAVTIGSGNLSLSGDNSHSGTFNPGTGTVTYTGGAQNIRSTVYNNLTFNSAGTKTASVATLTVNGTFTYTNSILAMGANSLVLLGNVSWAAGNITSTGSVTYNSASNQNVIPGTAATFTKNGTGTATLFANLVCTAGVTLTAGTLDLSNFNLNATTLAGAGTLTAGSGIITLTGNNTHSGTFNAGTSTVVYNFNAAQSFSGYSATGYYNLTVSNANTKTLSSALVVNNIFLLNATGIMAIGNNAASFNHFNQTAGTITLGTAALSFSGNVNKTAGTYTSGSGPLTFSGTGFVRLNAASALSSGATIIDGTRTIQGAGALTLSNVTVNGTLSNKINLIVNTALAGSGIFSQDSTASLLDVNFGGAGPGVSNFIVNTNGTVRYSFAGAQTTRSVAYNNLAGSNSGIKTISAGTSVVNNLDVSAPTSCGFSITIPGNVTGTSSFTLTGSNSFSITGNYGATGGVTIPTGGSMSVTGNLNYGAGVLTLNTATIAVSGNITGSGSITFSGAGNLNISGSFSYGAGVLSMNATPLTVGLNMTGSGAVTFSGSPIIDLNGSFSHGAGAVIWATASVDIAGAFNGNGAISFTGVGSLTFSGPGGWTSTSGAFTPAGTAVLYNSATGAQNVRSTSYANLTLAGASAKNYGTGSAGSVSGVFNNPAGQTLVYPAAATTLSLDGTIIGTGLILGDPLGTLTIGSPGVVTSSLGTLYFDTTKAFGTINFNRQWNRAIQVTIGSSVRTINYLFAGSFTVGGVQIADGEIFKLESAMVDENSTLPGNFPTPGSSSQIGRLRYICLGTGSKFVFEPSGTIPAGTNLTLPIGPLPTAGTPYQVLAGDAQGTLSAAIIGATAITGAATNFFDQLLIGYNLVLSNGTIVGEILALGSNTGLTLRAPGALVAIPANATFRLIQVYRPVTIIPSAPVTNGSLEIGFLNHSGGVITSGTNIPNLPSNRRTNFIYQIRGTGGFPTSAIWTEALLSNDFNATIDDAKYSFFRWNGSFWIKLAADLVGTGAVPTNTQIRRNSLTTMPGVQTFILGQTGGVLPDDPTFSWTGAGGNNNWKQPGNWNVFPTGAGSWPDDIGHNVILDGGGIGSPIIQTGDSINIKNIVHSGKKLTIQNNGILNILGNYSFNSPTLTAAGIGRLIQNGTAITGTNGSQFTTQLNQGTLLYTTEGGYIGTVRSIAGNAALTMEGIGGGISKNILDSSTFNIIRPTLSAGAGTLTSSTSNNVVAGTAFTSALNGRVLYNVASVIIGTVAHVQSSTSLILVNNAYLNVTTAAYQISPVVVPFGSGTTDFQDGSRVNYSSPVFDQTIAATSYSGLNFIDNRVGGNTDIVRYVNCPGQTITIRGRFRARAHIKPAASLGPIWQFNNNSRLSMIYPSGSNTAGILTNFSTNGVAGINNLKWGTISTDRIHYDAILQQNTALNFPTMDQTIGSKFGDMSLVTNQINGRFVLLPGSPAVTVNGSFNLTNTSGALNNVLNLGNNTTNPAVSLTLNGIISGLNNLTTAGAPVHQANLIIGGTGSISGDLFESVSQLRNFTLNRVSPSPTVSLSAALVLAVTEKITLANGTFGHTGTGTITVGSAAVSGIDVTGGTMTMSGSSNLSLITNGGFNLTAGTVNLNNTGSVSVAGSFSQTDGTFNRPTNPSTFQGNFTATAGSTNFTGSEVSFTGGNAQSVNGSASGLTLNNLTINKTGGAVTISSGKVKIIGSVNMLVTNSANLVTTVPGNLTLVSNATGTGRIGSVLGGTLGGSNFTMERFVNGAVQGWYFLGTPVSGQSIGDWGDDFDIKTPLTCPGALTDIIDRNTVYRFAGDAVPAAGSSPFEANGWRAPASCSINPGEGFRVFLPTKFFNLGSTFENTGSMSVGSLPLPISFVSGSYDNGGWNLVANPFPSNIDWDVALGWTKTNMQNAIYIYKGSTGSYGSYVAGLGINGVDNVIPTNQAFLVRAISSAPGPALVVNENAKTSSVKNLMRTATQNNVLRVKLGNESNTDETAIYFSTEATDGFDDQNDAAKVMNTLSNLYSFSGNQLYSIQGLSGITDQKVVPLGISAGAGNHSFAISGKGSFDSQIQIFLKDYYLNQMTEINGDEQVQFEINSDPASFGNSRFELIFINNAVTSIKAMEQGKMMVYPNPATNGVIKIDLKNMNSNGKISITDLMGRLISSQTLSGAAQSIQLNAPKTAGVYQVVFTEANGKSHTTKLVVE